MDRLTREWETRRTRVLQTEATIELSAFFPQGVNETNGDWLFPTISNRTNVFPDVSEQRIHHDARATPRSLSPKHPKSSPLLCATRGHYFTQMSVVIDPNMPNPQWIIPEDVNVEQNSDDIWRACANFISSPSRRNGKPRRTSHQG